MAKKAAATNATPSESARKLPYTAETFETIAKDLRKLANKAKGKIDAMNERGVTVVEVDGFDMVRRGKALIEGFLLNADRSLNTVKHKNKDAG